MQIWQNGGQLFSNIADWIHVLFSKCLKADMRCVDNKNEYNLLEAIYAVIEGQGLTRQ